MSLLIATIILRIVSACAESPYLTLSSLVTPSTSSATSSPKSAAQLVEGVRRVLDRVVQQGGHQGRLGHADVGQDRGDRERMGDVGVAALARSGRGGASRRCRRPARAGPGRPWGGWPGRCGTAARGPGCRPGSLVPIRARRARTPRPVSEDDERSGRRGALGPPRSPAGRSPPGLRPSVPPFDTGRQTASLGATGQPDRGEVRPCAARSAVRRRRSPGRGGSSARAASRDRAPRRPACSISSAVARAVPPVASTSSTTSTRSPGSRASRCISRVSLPYSRS